MHPIKGRCVENRAYPFEYFQVTSIHRWLPNHKNVVLCKQSYPQSQKIVTGHVNISRNDGRRYMKFKNDKNRT